MEKEWDSEKVFEMISIIERLKRRIEYLKDWKGIRKELHEEALWELQKILGDE